ncbi:hypothetical protein GCM10012275_59160 [Longimycelium tulufanense]|uniref:DUF6919 domain-containing protein n=1 Tax=Longimycelium tulufanense TaxID=907463 RepID=A0A8J3CKE0_9PSEU|nr:hypothetical protein [Longimycelium tulufanense]GGM80658.1 hypothetical protein GCM10012275_59160 [Longimycelium tulufanense]
MNEYEVQQWRTARGLGDLGELTAHWLTGDLASRPGYPPGEGPYVETHELIGTLAACNRGGFVTNASQPGFPESAGPDGVVWVQRAAVTGFAEEEVLERIRAAVAGTELVLLTPTATDRNPDGIVVTTRNGKQHTTFGTWLSRRAVADSFDVCKSAAIDALCSADQPTLVDPVWGRNTVLWPFLDDLFGTTT